MTKEQEEIINRLSKITNRQILYGNKCGITIEGFRELQEDIETVLNLLKQKDAEIEKKDKMIDLMAEFLGERDLGYYKNETGGEILGIMRKYNKEDWKEYFERKATNDG